MEGPWGNPRPFRYSGLSNVHSGMGIFTAKNAESAKGQAPKPLAPAAGLFCIPLGHLCSHG